MQCGVLPVVPGATLRNSVMLPAVPGQQSIDLPVLSLYTLSNVATLGDPTSAAAIACLVAKIVKHVVKAPSCVAVPFIVNRLYGVIPYFVLDLKEGEGAREDHSDHCPGAGGGAARAHRGLPPAKPAPA